MIYLAFKPDEAQKIIEGVQTVATCVPIPYTASGPIGEWTP